MKKLILTLAMISSSYAFASTTDIWEGPGTQFDAHGKATGNYNLVVQNVTTGTQIQSTVTITLADGTVKTEQCQITNDSAGGWKSLCGTFQGGGGCFGEGMCASYEADANGHAFATNVAIDGASDLRMLRTELQNGQATGFYREKLHKR
jgi:hypothetical protein